MKTRLRVVILAFILILTSIVVVVVLRYHSKSKFFKGVLLKSEIVIPSDSLGYVTDILCLGGDYLVVKDNRPFSKRGKIQIYSLKDFGFITSTGSAGSGPGELRNPSHLNYVPGSGFKFSVFDVSLKRLTVYILNDGVCAVDKIITIESGGVDQVHIVDDSTIAALDILSDGRVTLYDFSGKKRGTFGELLPGAKRGVPLDIHKAAMQGKLKVSPDGYHYVVISNFSDFVDVYDKNKNLVRFHGPDGFLPRYNVESFQGYPVMAIDVNKARWGYIDAFLTNKNIYALYSGNTFRNGSGGKFIHVYDFNGKLVATYLLDREVIGISFDHIGKRFFGIDKTATQILMFKID